MDLCLYVNHKAAIIAGKTRHGWQSVYVSEDMLAQLSPDERMLLAELAKPVRLRDLMGGNSSSGEALVIGAKIWNTSIDPATWYPKIAAADLDGIRAVLAAKRAHDRDLEAKAAKEDAERAAMIDAIARRLDTEGPNALIEEIHAGDRSVNTGRLRSLCQGYLDDEGLRRVVDDPRIAPVIAEARRLVEAHNDARFEQRLAEWEAKPDAELVCRAANSGRWSKQEALSRFVVDEKSRRAGNPQSAARLALLDLRATTAIAAGEQRDEEEKARAEAELRAWAEKDDELARAAVEGYDVALAVVDRVLDRLIAAVSEGGRQVEVLKEGSPRYDGAEWEERKAPRPAQFALRDEVVAAVASVERPSAIVVEVSRIMRVEQPVSRDAENDDEDDAESKTEKLTAVLVFIDSIVTKRRVIVVAAE